MGHAVMMLMGPPMMTRAAAGPMGPGLHVMPLRLCPGIRENAFTAHGTPGGVLGSPAHGQSASGSSTTGSRHAPGAGEASPPQTRRGGNGSRRPAPPSRGPEPHGILARKRGGGPGSGDALFPVAEITEKATEGRMKSSILVATAVVLFMSPAIASAASPCPPR